MPLCRDNNVLQVDYDAGLSGEVLVRGGAGGAERHREGWALVEVEPVRYQLEGVVVGAGRETTSETISLGSVLLVSPGEGEGASPTPPSWEEEELEWQYQGYWDWGQVRSVSATVVTVCLQVGGTVRGLPAIAVLGQQIRKFKWGLASTAGVTETHTVGRLLVSGSQTNITVTGRLVTTEALYTATLVCVFK